MTSLSTTSCWRCSLNNSRISAYLGLARRADKLVSGRLVLEAVRTHKSKLVIISEDTGANSRKQLLDKCRTYGVPSYILFTSDELSQAVGMKNVRSLSVNDVNLAEALRKEIERNEVD